LKPSIDDIDNVACKADRATSFRKILIGPSLNIPVVYECQFPDLDVGPIANIAHDEQEDNINHEKVFRSRFSFQEE